MGKDVADIIYARPVVIFINLAFAIAGNVLAGFFAFSITEPTAGGGRRSFGLTPLQTHISDMRGSLGHYDLFGRRSGAGRRGQGQAAIRQNAMAANIAKLTSDVECYGSVAGEHGGGAGCEGRAQPLSAAIDQLGGKQDGEKKS